LAVALAVESEVVTAEGAVRVDDVAVVARDAAVIASTAARLVPDITAERAHARDELLEDDGLSLDLADLLSDDPLGHLLKDKETLLDDLDCLTVADHLRILLYDSLLLDFTSVVIGTVEVVEAREGRDSMPVIKGVGVASSNISNWLGAGLNPRYRPSNDTSDHSRNGDDLEKLGEHF